MTIPEKEPFTDLKNKGRIVIAQPGFEPLRNDLEEIFHTNYKDPGGCEIAFFYKCSFCGV